jgi:hypothetical protein
MSRSTRVFFACRDCGQIHSVSGQLPTDRWLLCRRRGRRLWAFPAWRFGPPASVRCRRNDPVGISQWLDILRDQLPGRPPQRHDHQRCDTAYPIQHCYIRSRRARGADLDYYPGPDSCSDIFGPGAAYFCRPRKHALFGLPLPRPASSRVIGVRGAYSMSTCSAQPSPTAG